MRLLAISGSLRSGSYNSALLEAAAAESPSNVEFVVWRGLADIPAFNEDLGTVPPAVAALRREIARSDAVLIATPEYNASVPGALKDALDWVSRPFATNVLRNKPSQSSARAKGSSARCGRRRSCGRSWQPSAHAWTIANFLSAAGRAKPSPPTCGCAIYTWPRG